MLSTIGRAPKRFIAAHGERLGPPVILLGLIVAFSILEPRFHKTENVVNVGRQLAALGIVAVGETIVIISAGIDLSVGSVVALTGVVAAVLMKAGVPVPLAMAAGVGSGGAVGAFSGGITAFVRMPSFVVTLGMMLVCRGLALAAANRVTIDGLPAGFVGLSSPLTLVLVFLATAVCMALILRYTKPGRYAYAMGGNLEAARLSGIRVNLYQIVVFGLCGLLTGLAGVLLVARMSVASPTAAEGYELQAIAAVVIGGTSLFGGRGGVGGTIVGALIMAVLVNFLQLRGAPPEWEKVAVGATIIAAVFADYLRLGGARALWAGLVDRLRRVFRR
ncbi:MAG: ABC transporter permease [Armatimonadota bacterium]|jgi:ribose/xylose/arabinose/galactoside ABC-type transport system permease subunit